MIFFRHIIWFLFIILGIIVSGCLSSTQEMGGEKRTNRPDQESWDATITLTTEGLVRAIVQSGYLKKYRQKSFIRLAQSQDSKLF